MTTRDENEGQVGDHGDGGEFVDPKERVLDAMLHEVAGRQAVPDLTGGVLARLQGAASDPGIVRLPRRRTRVFAAMFGTVLGAAAAALVSTQILSGDDAPRRRAVAWHVVDGCLQWQSRAVTETAHGGERALWPVHTGDRLRTCEESAAVCDVSSLGRLRMTQGTEIEVAAMEWKSFAGGTALGAVTVAVVVGAIRWSGGGDIAQANTGESLELRAQAPQLTVAKVDELTQRVESLQKELLDEQARARELEAKAARTLASETPAVVPEVAVAAPALEHAVTYSGMEPVLGKIDWDVTGQCMFEMTKKLDSMYAALEKGEEMPLEVLGEVGKLNSELIKQAGQLVEAKVPGTGPNGVFTNPVVAANQLHATLTKAGMPLSNAQRDTLQRLSAEIAGADDARRAAVKDDDFDLAGVLGETELKDRFYREARQMLTPQQEQALFPARLAGSTANLFDTGLVWAQFAKPVTVSGREEFASELSQALTRQIGLSKDAAPQLQAAVDAWAQALPDEAFGTPDKLSGTGLGKLGPVRDAATRQLVLLRELSRVLPLTAEQKRKLRKAGAVYVPHKK